MSTNQFLYYGLLILFSLLTFYGYGGLYIIHYYWKYSLPLKLHLLAILQVIISIIAVLPFWFTEFVSEGTTLRNQARNEIRDFNKNTVMWQSNWDQLMKDGWRRY